MSRPKFIRPADWRDAALVLIAADDRGWSSREVVARLGIPPGEASAANVLADTAKRGRLRPEGGFGNRTYFATESTVEKASRAERFRIVGWGCPRVSSVWDYAERRAA